MRIGEFAKAAGVPASVLRHYDKVELLVPDYIDSFTGYRHYSARQLEDIRRITLLKQAGLSLKEIRKIQKDPGSIEPLKELLEHHETKHRDMLVRLEEAKKAMLKKNGNLSDSTQNNYGITEETGDGEILLKSTPLPLPPDPQVFQTTCDLLDEEAAKRDYQRISGFMTLSNEDGNSLQVAIRVIKLNGAVSEVTYLGENIDIPFEDDERVIGRWKVLRDYAVKDDFYSGLSEGLESNLGGTAKEIYFLPDGEKYWVYGWTKDYLILNTGEQQCLCRYEVEDHDGKRYLFVEEKGYEFRRGGIPRVLVLEQLDNKRYTKQEIMHKDNLDMPFVNDEQALGIWVVYDYIRCREDFEVGKRHRPISSLYFKKMCFMENGAFTSQYGEKTVGSDVQSWTKGYVLRHFNHTACAYEIVTVDGTDYMIVEWKSGDYCWGGRPVKYYVFVRGEEE